jgi:4-diphosphocytidyl-2-C-methyl-D-erythritol kinase
LLKTLCLTAPAKINLYLKVMGQRPDGYHELNTLMQKLSLHDQLYLTPVREQGIQLCCPDSDLPMDERNIVYRAARLFQDQTGNREQGIAIVLKKNIPVAAGLGGGSSDAAVVLNGLNRLFAANCPTAQLADMGLALGADVPLFVSSLPAAWATGIGEELIAAVPLAGYRVLLVNPGISVSTKWVFETFALTVAEKKISLSCSQMECPAIDRGAKFCKLSFQPEALRNDLEEVTAGKLPVIEEIKEQLLTLGAAGAMMSGSGSTVFALFRQDDEEQRLAAYQHFKQKYEQVFLTDPLT